MLNYKTFYNLFHGTTKLFADSIIKNKEFKIIERDDHWLANGVYFFVNDYDKAKWWGRQACIRQNRLCGEKQDYSVLHLCNYQINRHDILDLDTETDRKRVSEFIEEFKKNNLSTELDNSDFDDINRRRALILEIFISYYDVIASKKTFEKETPKRYKGLQYLEYMGINNNEVQFCIYDTSTIDFNFIKIM